MIYPVELTVDVNNLHDIWDADVEQYVDNIKCIESRRNYEVAYCCFNFAFDDEELGSTEEAFEILLFNGYKRVTIGEAREGDIITYHDDFERHGVKQIDEYSVQHYAIISKTDGTVNGTEILSKWGSDGVFQSTIEDVPDLYGEVIAIWRKI